MSVPQAVPEESTICHVTFNMTFDIVPGSVADA
jgi:hypothetical protein